MKKLTIFLLLCISLFAFKLPEWFEQKSTDINTLVKKANRLHKKVVLFFDLEDCPWCEKMIKNNFSGGKLTDKTKKNFIVVHISNEGERVVVYKNFKGSESDFKDKMGVYFSPTMIFLDSNGNVIGKFEGYRNPSKYETILAYILSGDYKKMKYIDFYNEYQFDKN